MLFTALMRFFSLPGLLILIAENERCCDSKRTSSGSDNVFCSTLPGGATNPSASALKVRFGLV